MLGSYLLFYLMKFYMIRVSLNLQSILRFVLLCVYLLQMTMLSK